MSETLWTAIAGLLVTLLLNMAGYLVAWGALKSTVKALGQRVETLEGEAGSVGEIRVQIAKIETRLDGLLEQFRDLNSAIRWMRVDALSAHEPAPGVTPPRRGNR